MKKDNKTSLVEKKIEKKCFSLIKAYLLVLSVFLFVSLKTNPKTLRTCLCSKPI